MNNPTQDPAKPDVLAGEDPEDTRERLEIALEASEMGVFDVDLTTRSARTTLRHNQIFGYTEPVPAWSPEIFLEHVVDEDRPLMEEAFERALETGRFDLCARVRWPDGSIRWMRDWGRMYFDERGQPVRLVGVTEDVTSAKETEEALRAAKREAEEANRTKTRFLAMMSHELRTPLTAIIGMAEVLSAVLPADGDGRGAAAAERIRTTAWHMAGLVDDLLSIARSETGHEEVNPAEVDLASLGQEVVSLLDREAAGKGIRLRLEGADQPVPLRTDPGKARQILTNLAGNAVKYTRAGEVVVSMEREAGGGVVIRVRDTGPGIAPDDRERIFEPFTQLHELPGGAGTGLGLAIARRLARLLGGDLELESELGLGSTFTVRLAPL